MTGHLWKTFNYLRRREVTPTMKLEAVVSEISLGENYVDGVDRVLLRFRQADDLYRSIRIPINLFPVRPELGEVVTLELNDLRVAPQPRR